MIARSAIDRDNVTSDMVDGYGVIMTETLS